jgi:hypothetical protein
MKSVSAVTYRQNLSWSNLVGNKLVIWTLFGFTIFISLRLLFIILLINLYQLFLGVNLSKIWDENLSLKGFVQRRVL